VKSVDRMIDADKVYIALFIIRCVVPKLSFLHFLNDIVICSLKHALVLRQKRSTFAYVTTRYKIYLLSHDEFA